MALILTEKWVKQKINIKNENYDDVKSLALPGSYEEKITTISTGLSGFTRLKNLDLSRNFISSLDGLSHLLLLETLNLYYNKINSLHELFKLRANKNLQDLDVRLNPVTKCEPDYRLFLVHMLPKLTRLDDRIVKAKERSAALLHFTEDQAFQFDAYSIQSSESPENLTTREISDVPRADLVHRLGRPSVLDDDEEHVLNMITQPSQGITKMSKHLGKDNNDKQQKSPRAENYSQKELEKLPPYQHQDNMKVGSTKVKSPPNTEKRETDPHKDRPWEALAPNKYCHSVAYGTFTSNPDMQSTKLSQDQWSYDPSKLAHEPSKLSHEGKINSEKKSSDASPDKDNAAHNPEKDIHIPTTRYKAVLDARDWAKDYIHPEVGKATHRKRCDVIHDGDLQNNHIDQESRVSENTRDMVEMEQLNNITSFRDPDLYELLERIVTLVEKHWNGPKSLQKSRRFQDIMMRVLSSYLQKLSQNAKGERSNEQLHEREEAIKERDIKLKEREDMLKELQGKTYDVIEQYKLEVERKEAKLKDHKQEISELKEQIHQKDQLLSKDEEIQERLHITDRDMVTLKDTLQKVQSENKQLMSQLANAHQTAQEKQPMQTQYDTIVNKLMSSETEKRGLQDQCTQQINTLSQLQDLTSMLQESHRSLVTTNDHLLRELDECKQRHQNEVRQLNWSYEQLKKTCDWIPKT